MATIDYKQLATPEANLIELLAAQNQDGTYTAKLMGSEPFAVLAAKTIYNAYNDIEDNMAADVEGPASSTDNALARFDGTTGKLLQNSNAILTDAGSLSLAVALPVTSGGTGVTTSTGSGSNVLSNAPTLTNPVVTGTIVASGALTASDLIFGSSGPSAKSTLSARAPRQGLVFDGTAGATATISALGTAPFTVSAVFSAKSLAANNVIIDYNTVGYSILIYVKPTGILTIYDRAANVALYNSNTGVIEVNKIYHIAYSRGVGVFVNGVNISGSFADGSNYTDTVYRIGWAASSDSFCTGFLSILIYNRALSASEVVALYEAGAPAGADYWNLGAGVQSNGTWNNDTGCTLSGVSATGFTNTPAGYSECGCWIDGSGTKVASVGQKIRVKYTATVTSGSPTFIVYYGSPSNSWDAVSIPVTTGSAEFVYTMSKPGSVRLRFATNAAANYSISSFSVSALGLLLAPDAAQAGGGLTWYDTSGNAANISWTSGVSWNVPSSQKTASGWTFGGNLTVSGASGGLTNLITGNSSAGNYIFWDANASPSASDGYSILGVRAFSSLTGSKTQVFGIDVSKSGAGTDNKAKVFFNLHNGTNLAPFMSVTDARDTTLAGNLTVSGTGPSTFGTTNTVSITDTSLKFTGSAASPGALSLFSNSNILFVQSGSAGIYFNNAAGSATNAVLTNSGNLLVGTTTDSANGKLQLATHTTSAGGIGFGTGTSLFNNGTSGVLNLTKVGGGGLGGLNLYSDTQLRAALSYSSTTAYLDAPVGDLVFRTSGTTTALTLDSSQNATFAGKVGIGVSPASWELNLQQSAVNSAVRIISPTALGLNDSSIYISWASGSKALIAASYESTGSYRPLVLSAGGVDSLTLDTSGNSTFAGNIKTAAPSGGTAATWRLGTVASVSPTSPNRTIEVEIGGTTYYIHAKTTNN